MVEYGRVLTFQYSVRTWIRRAQHFGLKESTEQRTTDNIYIYIYIYEKSTVRPASVGLAQARPKNRSFTQTALHSSSPSKQARQVTAGFFRQRLAYYTQTARFMAVKSTAHSPSQPWLAHSSNHNRQLWRHLANFGMDYVTLHHFLNRLETTPSVLTASEALEVFM